MTAGPTDWSVGWQRSRGHEPPGSLGAEPEPPRADPRCGVPRVRHARLPGHGRRRHRGRRGDARRAASTSTSRTRNRSSASSWRRPPTSSSARVEKAVAQETEPVARAEVAIHTVLTTFAGHRTMARLLFLDTMGAGRVFQAETNALHERFARLIQGYLDEAVAAGGDPADRHAHREHRLVRRAQRGGRALAPRRSRRAGSRTPIRPSARSCCGRVGVGEPRIAAVPLPAIADGALFPEQVR